MARILLNDSVKIADIKKYTKHFTKNDLKAMEKNEFRITYGQYFHVGQIGVGVYDAGHVPGSVSFHLDTGTKKIVYSGDMKVQDTELLKGLEPIREDTDILIMESTYSQREHPPREKQEKALAERIKITLDNNGIAMLPSFAVGRAQELLLILKKYGLDKYPVYLDGMAVDATKTIVKELKKMFSSVTKVYNNRQRNNLIKEPCIIVTTSGMLNGGPIVHYLEKLHDRKECSLTLSGFQVPGSAGRELLDTGKYIGEEKSFKVDCDIDIIDLSAHAGRNELFKYIKMVDPQKIFVIHGDSCQEFASELKERGYDAYAPSMGETCDI